LQHRRHPILSLACGHLRESNGLTLSATGGVSRLVAADQDELNGGDPAWCADKGDRAGGKTPSCVLKGGGNSIVDLVYSAGLGYLPRRLPKR
jgi:hypothetical protein